LAKRGSCAKAITSRVSFASGVQARTSAAPLVYRSWQCLYFLPLRIAGSFRPGVHVHSWNVNVEFVIRIYHNWRKKVSTATANR